MELQDTKAQPSACGINYIKTYQNTYSDLHVSRNNHAPNSLPAIAYSDLSCYKSPKTCRPGLRYSDFWTRGPANNGVLRAPAIAYSNLSCYKFPAACTPRKHYSDFGLVLVPSCKQKRAPPRIDFNTKTRYSQARAPEPKE